MELLRHGDQISAKVDGQLIGATTITDPARKALLHEPHRFKLYGWQGGTYQVRDAILVDGR